MATPSGPLDTIASPAEPQALVRRPTDARDRAMRRHEPTIIGAAAVVLFFVVWQGVGIIRETAPDGLALGPFKFIAPSQLFLPTPLDIARAFQAYSRPRSTFSSPIG